MEAFSQYGCRSLARTSFQAYLNIHDRLPNCEGFYIVLHLKNILQNVPISVTERKGVQMRTMHFSFRRADSQSRKRHRFVGDERRSEFDDLVALDAMPGMGMAIRTHRWCTCCSALSDNRTSTRTRARKGSE